MGEPLEGGDWVLVGVFSPRKLLQARDLATSVLIEMECMWMRSSVQLTALCAMHAISGARLTLQPRSLLTEIPTAPYWPDRQESEAFVSSPWASPSKCV